MSKRQRKAVTQSRTRILERAREWMRTRRQAEPPTPPAFVPGHALSGEIPSCCKRVPLGDLAARWKVTPAMLRECAGNGLFQVVITESGGIVDYWYLDRAVWPHGQKKYVVPQRGLVHSLLDPPVEFMGNALIFVPAEEVFRIEAEGGGRGGVIDRESGALTVKEAAQMCECTERTIRNWVRTGKLAHIRMPGGGIRIEREAVKQFIR